jgi:hypothetical protein
VICIYIYVYGCMNRYIYIYMPSLSDGHGGNCDMLHQVMQRKIVCIYMCMYVCMYVCMYLYIYALTLSSLYDTLHQVLQRESVYMYEYVYVYMLTSTISQSKLSILEFEYFY